jgi:hypothetical protein
MTLPTIPLVRQPDDYQSNIRLPEGAGTYVWPLSDGRRQTFNVTGVRTVVLPSTGVRAGDRYVIQNNGSAYLTAQPAGVATIIGVCQGNTLLITALTDAPTLVAHWKVNGNCEYASNSSSATTVDDTTSFSYGQAGNLIRAITVTLSRTVGFLTPILPTDIIMSEIYTPTTGGLWLPTSNHSYPLLRQNGAYYGMGIISTNAAANTVNMRFGVAPLIESGATWASFNLDTLGWRVQKLSKY